MANVLLWLYDSLAKAEQYLGEGGPESNIKKESESRPGDQDTLNLQGMKQRGIAE